MMITFKRLITILLLVCLQSRGSYTPKALITSGYYLTDGTNFYIPYNQVLATLPPSPGSFTGINMGTSTVSAVGGALLLHAPSRVTGCTTIPCNSIFLNMQAQSIGANTTLTGAIQYTSHFWPFVSCGLFFRESATGKVVTVDFGSNNDAVLSNAVGVNHYTNETTFSATVGGTGAIFPNTVFFQLVKSGGVLQMNWSSTGAGGDWLTIHQENYNSFFTTAPDQWGWYADNEFGTSANTSTDLWLTLLSYKTQ